FVIGMAITAGLVASNHGPASAFARPGLGQSRSLPAPSAPPPSVSPPSAPSARPPSVSAPGRVGGDVQMNRRPSLYRDQLDPRGPGSTPGPPRPGGDHGGRGRRGGYYYDPFYYDPFYGPDYGFGYGLFPYGGPFGAYDYYYNRSQYGPYDSGVSGD